MNNHELVDAEVPETRVGRTILVKGEIEGDGDVIVEGRVEGSVSIKGDLHIQEDGQVRSRVSARNVFVHGILVGPATASEKVELAANGRMVGDVHAPRFLINEGASYKGAVDMLGFEAEERSTESLRASRQSEPARAQRTPQAPARSLPRPAPERRERPRPASSSMSKASHSSIGNVYTPPPPPRTPEFVGVKKAIIIKKKSSENT